MFLPLMSQLHIGREAGRPRTRPDTVRADKAYSSRAIRTHLRSRGIKAVIPESDDQKGHRKVTGENAAARASEPKASEHLETTEGDDVTGSQTP